MEFGLSHDLAGIMVWSIETDDFNNVCGGGDFPILRAINKALGIDSITATVPTTALKASMGNFFFYI